MKRGIKWNWKTGIYAGLRMAALFYVLVLTLLFFFQEHLIFFPTPLAADHIFHFASPIWRLPIDGQSTFEERWLTSGGLKLNSLYFPVPKSPGVILYFHGNAGCLEDWGEVACELAWRTGWSVWAVDFPGYGKSQGSISSEDQLYQLGRDLYKAAADEFPRVVIFGRSIGTGIAAHSARPPARPFALILESPYYSLVDLAKTKFPWAPLFLLKYKFKTFRDLAELPEGKLPILLLHGEDDELIPYTQSLKLKQDVPNLKLVSIAGGHHNDLSESATYWSALKEFLK